jgi:uroporphyrinogen decarboxylase
LHSDGNLTGLLPLVVEAGFAALHPIEPCGDAFSIYQVKAEFGTELCLFGNIDVSGPLSQGHPDQVMAEVREHIERLAEGGGYVVSSSHSIQNSIPPANFKAMLDAVLTYGPYRSAAATD